MLTPDLAFKQEQNQTELELKQSTNYALLEGLTNTNFDQIEAYNTAHDETVTEGLELQSLIDAQSDKFDDIETGIGVGWVMRMTFSVFFFSLCLWLHE